VKGKGKDRHESAATITQSDVARIAKVSTGTVSRVINDHPLVSTKAKRQVLEAIKQLGYWPNKAAQALANGETKSVLLLFVDEHPIMPSTWQYELPILQGVESYLKRFGYAVQISMHTRDEAETPGFIDTLLWNRLFDGILVLTSLELGKSMIVDLHERRIPTIFIGNGPYKGIDRGISVLFDNYRVIKEIFSALFELGHRKIAFIKGTARQQHARLRLKGYRQALREHNMGANPLYEFDGSYNVPSGYSAMERFLDLEEPPTAVIAANDLMAIGAMRAIKDRGLCVPDDVSVVGFDDIEISEFLEPSLSSVKVPSPELGAMSAESLYGLMQGESAAGTSITLPATFVVRDSVARRR
jgi:LacI family repressor for deo operon, udp, cdd, tsx, nupC, and nupG